MRLAIVGSRHFELWSTRDLIIHSWQLVLHVLGEPEVIVTGCAKDVDEAARELAKHLTGKKPVIHRADWTKHGKAAGPKRNALLAADSDAAVIIWNGISPGSRDVLSRFRDKPHIELITEAP